VAVEPIKVLLGLEALAAAVMVVALVRVPA
jgi:hypothetical protein